MEEPAGFGSAVGSGAGARRAPWVRIPPPPPRPASPNRSGQRPYKTFGCGFKSRRGHAAACSCSSDGRALVPHTSCRRFESSREHGGCSSVRSERRVVVPVVAGSNPVSHPKRARRRWRVGAGCNPVACLRGFESLRPHHALVAQRKRAGFRNQRPEVRLLSGAHMASRSFWVNAAPAKRVMGVRVPGSLRCHPLWNFAGGRWLSSRDSYPRPARIDTGTCDGDGVLRSRSAAARCYRLPCTSYVKTGVTSSSNR
jgi:hypothetical protein